MLNTNFWRKQAESLSKDSENVFVRNLLLKARGKGYEGGVIFKMIVRASDKLDKMVKELKSDMLVIRDEISSSIPEHDCVDCNEETGEHLCVTCAVCRAVSEGVES